MHSRRCPGEYAAAFLFGFFAYGLLEIGGRGYTHWTMGILGGAAFSLLYSMDTPRIVCAVRGCAFVTACEFTAGIIENRMLGWHVWDYSDQPLNLLGQICPLFTAVWLLLCFLASGICARMRRCYA